MAKRPLLPLVFLAAAVGAMADEPGYVLRIEASVSGSQLTVVPHIAAPAGARLRYELVSSKQGSAGRSSTSQSGSVNVGADGSAALSTLKLGINPQDKYLITVKVLDGAKVVAEEVLQYPR